MLIICHPCSGEKTTKSGFGWYVRNLPVHCNKQYTFIWLSDEAAYFDCVIFEKTLRIWSLKT